MIARRTTFRAIGTACFAIVAGCTSGRESRETHSGTKPALAIQYELTYAQRNRRLDSEIDDAAPAEYGWARVAFEVTAGSIDTDAILERTALRGDERRPTHAVEFPDGVTVFTPNVSSRGIGVWENAVAHHRIAPDGGPVSWNVDRLNDEYRVELARNVAPTANG